MREKDKENINKKRKRKNRKKTGKEGEIKREK